MEIMLQLKYFAIWTNCVSSHSALEVQVELSYDRAQCRSKGILTISGMGGLKRKWDKMKVEEYLQNLVQEEEVALAVCLNPEADPSAIIKGFSSICGKMSELLDIKKGTAENSAWFDKACRVAPQVLCQALKAVPRDKGEVKQAMKAYKDTLAASKADIQKAAWEELERAMKAGDQEFFLESH
ncbi:hypothetical protein NDU88_000507 [Pleurodeles waltl]|uniref:Uncharacterized protein n=1 Tax=Pleurodeles waltl TaxID=8319 RepID=A0AAV7TFR7_PLEWA|nr:hypothetical protein NDU88_000507 [Pleurodeles waltl]